MLEMTRTDPEWKEKIITGGETWVYGYDPETKRQSAEWRGQAEPRPKKIQEIEIQKEGVAGRLFRKKGIVHHEYLPAGQTVIKEMSLGILRRLRTISRRLVANGLHSCRPLRRLPLTPPNRRQRLEWCRARSTWMTEWHRVVFSDESRFCLSSDSRRVRVWRRRGERSNPAAIVERPTVRQRGIMVWGAFAYDSRSPLLRIQGTMTAQRYVDDVLRPVTLPYLQGVPNALYQDNARPHTARISQQALQDVQMLPWPPYSPELSPIEHVWDIIGRRLHALPQPRSEDELWQMPDFHHTNVFIVWDWTFQFNILKFFIHFSTLIILLDVEHQPLRLLLGVAESGGGCVAWSPAACGPRGCQVEHQPLRLQLGGAESGGGCVAWSPAACGPRAATQDPGCWSHRGAARGGVPRDSGEPPTSGVFRASRRGTGDLEASDVLVPGVFFVLLPRGVLVVGPSPAPAPGERHLPVLLHLLPAPLITFGFQSKFRRGGAH
ncbi:hypothetical protein LAZ67_4001791 [Cordylochernes scorpioides]|uniref:Transposable element Tc1 transposase n=1 Tax=Cordylochernes scorpioides TaxID=51811 RepID=A0ABY6KCF5_9ARAC|nr:hypothetical protein LAZ67_4001791 [Cordylochernes scorpioides]